MSLVEKNSLGTEDVIHSDMSDRDALHEKLDDAATPGFHQVEFDPDEAEQAGAFEEDALSEADALNSVLDLG